MLNPGEAGTREAIMMAGFGGFKVISVDYRMPPDFPLTQGFKPARYAGISIAAMSASEHQSELSYYKL